MACSKVVLLRTGVAPAGAQLFGSFLCKSYGRCKATPRRYSIRCSLEPPDVPRLADTARISLSPKEVGELSHSNSLALSALPSHLIRVAEFFWDSCSGTVVLTVSCTGNWFGQLQAVDLESIEPTLRADAEVDDNLRPDSAVTFENKAAGWVFLLVTFKEMEALLYEMASSLDVGKVLVDSVSKAASVNLDLNALGLGCDLLRSDEKGWTDELQQPLLAKLEMWVQSYPFLSSSNTCSPWTSPPPKQLKQAPAQQHKPLLEF
ncbi:hypothetical protein ACLOJK_000331 [Asimina triloba]